MELSVGEAKSLEKLRFWKLEKFITAHQACQLATGVDPGSNVFGFDYFVAVSGYEPIKSALASKLTEYYFIKSDLELDESLGISPKYDEFFCPENIKSPSSLGGEENDIYLYRIKQTAIKGWLKSEGIFSAYFESLVDNNPNDNQFQRAKSLDYSTKLMSIMDKAIQRYYGENFDIEDKDSYPKQDHIIEWLKTQFSLSNRQAEAIEIVISPRGEKAPKSKNI